MSDWTPERRAEAERLWRAGYSAAEIARQIGGVSRNGVIGVMYRAGITSNRGSHATAPRPVSTKVAAPSALRKIAVPPPSPSARGQDFGPSIKAAVSPPKLRVVEVRSEPKTLAQFRSVHDGRCRWPLDISLNEATAESLFCAAPVREEGCSYCAAHAALSVQKWQPKTISVERTADRRRFNGRHFKGANATRQFAE